MGWGDAHEPAPRTLGGRMRTAERGAASMLDEVLDLTQPHEARDRRIQDLENANRKLRDDLAAALTELGLVEEPEPTPAPPEDRSDLASMGHWVADCLDARHHLVWRTIVRHLADEVAQLRTAIGRYGRHLSSCPVVTRGSDCECGLERWIA